MCIDWYPIIEKQMESAPKGIEHELRNSLGEIWASAPKGVPSSIVAQWPFPGSEYHSLYWVIIVSQPREFNRNIKESLVSPHPFYRSCTDTCAGRLFIIPSSFIHQCIVIPSKYLQAARYRDFQRHQHCLGSCHRQIVASLILDPLEPVILLAL